jgi:hypothetical protein
MNWKKYLLIALAVGAFGFAAVPRSEARVSVGIGLGFPFGYSNYGYGYPYGYGYGYSRAYPYDYYGYPREVIYVGPRHRRHYVRRVNNRYQRASYRRNY